MSLLICPQFLQSLAPQLCQQLVYFILAQHALPVGNSLFHRDAVTGSELGFACGGSTFSAGWEEAGTLRKIQQ
jgi:hypothetical protein